jgi:soluble lytic murein transglycosylase
MIRHTASRFALALLATTAWGDMSFAAAPQNLPPLARPSYQPPPKPTDWELYASVFAAQNEAKWRTADELIGEISDPILLGHVYYQRYMHPTAYRTSWRELKSWLTKYADHPGAWRVYQLAEKRRPRGSAMPKSPPARVYHNTSIRDASSLFRSRAARRISNEVKRLVYRERPTQALRYISYPNRDRQLSAAETDHLKSLIARSFYIEGKPKDALKLAREATRSRVEVPLTDWHAGLSAYRLKDFKTAQHHFDVLSKAQDIGQDTRASALFWLGRSLIEQKQQEQAFLAFEKAAHQGLNFYALLAFQIVHGDVVINWQQMERVNHEVIAHYPAVQRALALDKADQRELAELELLYLQERLPENEVRGILDLAKNLNHPAVEMAITRRFKSFHTSTPDNSQLSAFEGNYPILNDEEIGGFALDRALVLALIRQESAFKARAKSHAGARGLMQVMPRTAAFVTGDRSLARRSGRDQLLDSETNVNIGQRYLKMLLGKDYFSGNLIYALASYNAGPGNLKRWRRELGSLSDPLLFIESISSPETRKYVQRVLLNMWVYRSRLGQEPTEVRQLASDTWPHYAPQDSDVKQAKSQ